MENKPFRLITVKSLIIIFLLVLIVRGFAFESVRIDSNQMESSIHPGDHLLVNKWSYGLRLPMTWLAVPFAHDTLPALGIKSYTDILQTGYHRLASSGAQRNDVVMFNHPGKQFSQVPTDKKPVCISRCIGLPGDSLSFSGKGYLANNVFYTDNNSRLAPYLFREEGKGEIISCITKGNRKIRTTKVMDNHYLIFISRKELNTTFKTSLHLLEAFYPESDNYSLWVPRKDKMIRASKQNTERYKDIILSYELPDATIKDSLLYRKGKPVQFITFKQNYYWVLSDNRETGEDSRAFGFVPESHLIGKAFIVWKSDQDNWFKTIQ
ncbi:MAG: signal peptidase I [Bacteroidales bacterium]